MDPLPSADASILIAELRLRPSWLEHIAESLLGTPFNRAHVREIGRDIVRRHPERRAVSAIEETITREINNFCGDAKDFNRGPRFNLFERVEPATYRLLRAVDLAEIIDLQNEIRWVSGLSEGWLWEKFVERVPKDRRREWNALPLSQRLARFGLYARKPQVRDILEKLRRDEAELLA